MVQQDIEDYAEARTIGSIGQIVGPGRTFETYEDSYDWLVHFPVYSDGALCAYSWQLEPARYDGMQPVDWSECLWQPEGVAA
ncbi:hypothetical protein LA76x_1326 [Lysobacter antibioticus]|uniref:Uncharacterized protein n=1 Tax=Lysobacter antibioticus TaxID=84531 RepID=A0A0S2F7J2_LYSAN|nr:hypothetical protein LA76x_1326 [Lysobacter antibioticus]